MYIEILKTVKQSAVEKAAPHKVKTKEKPAPLTRIDQALIDLLTESVNDLADESGWAFLGELGNFILKKQRDFDPRNYGFPKFIATHQKHQ